MKKIAMIITGAAVSMAILGGTSHVALAAETTPTMMERRIEIEPAG